MAEIINLRRARKARSRAAAAETAAANRARHGRTKAETQRSAREQEQAGHHLDQHRIAKEPEDEAP